MEGVSKVTQTSHPYKLASREYQRENTVIKVKDVEIGGDKFVIMGGPVRSNLMPNSKLPPR